MSACGRVVVRADGTGISRPFDTHMSRRLTPEIARDLTDVTYQLCHPNPARRGHRRNRIGVEQPYGLARFISAFDLLRMKASVHLRRPSLHPA